MQLIKKSALFALVLSSALICGQQVQAAKPSAAPAQETTLEVKAKLDAFAKSYVARANDTLKNNRQNMSVTKQGKGYVARYTEVDASTMTTEIYPGKGPGCEYVGHIVYLEKVYECTGKTISEAKTDVPFSTIFEVLIMLLAFEAVQEAGLRLPGAIGQTASILGGLVVGSAAVEASIVSPVVLIVVAIAGIAGYTVPSQEFAAALRIWRFGLAIAASLGGLFGVMALAAVLVYRLAQLESFGVPYLTPFAASGDERAQGHGVIRWPTHWVKFRERALGTQNQRRQG